MINITSKTNNNISYLIYENKVELLNLKHEWDDLSLRACNSHGFLSYAWLSSFLEKNKFSGTPIGFAMLDNERLKAILFLQIKSFMGIKYAIPLGDGEAYFWGILHDFSDEYDWFNFSSGFLRYLKLKLFYIDDLYSKDQLSKNFISELIKLKYTVKYQKRDVCLSINFKGNFENYYNDRKTKKQQKEIAKKILRFKNAGYTNIEKFHGTELNECLVERIYKIQTKSWLIQRGIKTLNNDFIKTIICNLINYEYARAWILTLDGDDVAFRLGFRSHEVYYSYWTAFDKRYKDLRPGLFLNRYVLEDCCKEGIKHYEFMHGDGEHKRFWYNEENVIERVIIYRGFLGAIIAIPFKLKWLLSKNDFLKLFINKLKIYKTRFLKRKIFKERIIF